MASLFFVLFFFKNGVVTKKVMLTGAGRMVAHAVVGHTTHLAIVVAIVWPVAAEKPRHHVVEPIWKRGNLKFSKKIWLRRINQTINLLHYRKPQEKKNHLFNQTINQV